MKIILTSDVENLGEVDDLVDVASGYARNYLIPQGLAIKATNSAINELKRRQAVEARQEERMAARAEALSEQLRGVTLVFEAKASEETGRLFGSITTAEIAEALGRKVGETFDRRKHILSEPLREIGEHTVTVRLTKDVEVDVTTLVKPEGGELPEKSNEDQNAVQNAVQDELESADASATTDEA